jgi:hypothetical protein
MYSNHIFFIQNTKYNILDTPRFQRGAAAISTILIIGAIVAEVAIASLVASYLASQGGLGVRIVYNASFAAQSGIDDALIKITRNKDFTPPSLPYTISVGLASAQVTVCKELTASSGSCGAPSLASNTFDIISLGIYLTKQVRMRATIYVDPITGLVTIQSLQEIST